MSFYNPRLVAQALEDLESEISRWSNIARDMLTTARDTQLRADESLDRDFHYAAILLDRVKGDEVRVEKALASVALDIENCATAAETARNTLYDANEILKEANNTRQKWQTELEKAMSWFARAEARSEKALLELESARSVLGRAVMDLIDTESRLKVCQNKHFLRDCRGEVAAVGKARAEVTRANKNVRSTEQEVNAAKQNIDRAKARVACCKSAVALSTEAVNLSRESVQRATQSVDFAERSVEAAHAAVRLVNMVQETVLVEIEAAENMMADTKRAQEFSHDAKMHLQRADNAENIAQTYVTAIRAELGYRIQQLLDLNHPAILHTGDEPSPKKAKVYPRLDIETPMISSGKREGTGQIIDRHGYTAFDQSRDIENVHRQSLKEDKG